MFEQREVIPLVLSLGVAVFALRSWRLLCELPRARWLGVSFGLLVASFSFSVVEEVAWARALNVLQHAAHAASIGVLAAWTWLALRPEGAE